MQLLDALLTSFLLFEFKLPQLGLVLAVFTHGSLSDVLRLDCIEIGLWHSDTEPACGLRSLDLGSLNKNFILIEPHLSDLAFNVNSNVVWLQVNVQRVRVHKTWYFHIKDELRFVSALIQ